MKTFKMIAFVLAIGLMAVGCNKVEKILPKKDGVWKSVSEVTRYYTGATLDSTVTETSGLATYTFTDDGNGTWTDGNDSGVFTWTVNDDNDVLTMCESSGGFSFCILWDILESSKSAQFWTTSITDFFDPNDHTELDIELEAVK